MIGLKIASVGGGRIGNTVSASGRAAMKEFISPTADLRPVKIISK